MKTKDRETYLKFKSMADDLRQAESWCDLDGVLNRYETMQNLYKMGYRKQSEGEWLTDRFGLERSICSVCGAVYEGDGGNYCRRCGAKMKGGKNEPRRL